MFPSLLAWSAVPLRDSEAELKVLEAVSVAELAMFLNKSQWEVSGGGFAAKPYFAASILSD